MPTSNWVISTTLMPCRAGSDPDGSPEAKPRATSAVQEDIVVEAHAEGVVLVDCPHLFTRTRCRNLPPVVSDALQGEPVGMALPALGGVRDDPGEATGAAREEQSGRGTVLMHEPARAGRHDCRGDVDRWRVVLALDRPHAVRRRRPGEQRVDGDATRDAFGRQLLGHTDE